MKATRPASDIPSINLSAVFLRSTTLSPFHERDSSRHGFACAALFCRRQRPRSTWREMLMGMVRACTCSGYPLGGGLWNYGDRIKAPADRSYCASRRCDVPNYFIMSVERDRRGATWRNVDTRSRALGQFPTGNSRHVGRGYRWPVRVYVRRTTGQWPCLRRVRSLIVFASSTVQWPKLPGYTCLPCAISSRKGNCVGTRPLGSRGKKKRQLNDERYSGLRCTSNVEIDCAYISEIYKRVPFFPRSIMGIVPPTLAVFARRYTLIYDRVKR